MRDCARTGKREKEKCQEKKCFFFNSTYQNVSGHLNVVNKVAILTVTDKTARNLSSALQFS